MSTETASKKYVYARKMAGHRNPVKNPGPPNRKQAARLSRRIADYATMMQSSKAPDGAFHQPGSMQ